MEWIKTSDRLPLIETKVLVYAPSSGMNVAETFLVETHADKYLHWQIDCEGYNDSIGMNFEDVTHWMPLPEIPKYE